MLQHHQNLNTG